MEQILWMAAAAIFAASTAGCLVLLAAGRSSQRRTRRPDGREVYLEYETPVYPGQGGFRLEELPDTDTLTATRYWLVDDSIAEVEFSVFQSDDVTLRAAPSGSLRLPLHYRGLDFESSGSFAVGETRVTLYQSPGRESMFTWTRDGFDFAVFAPGAEMNLMGGLSTEFVTGTAGKTQR